MFLRGLPGDGRPAGGADFPWRRERQGAFTLVEVVLALGISSFVLTAILGLLSVGLGTLRRSVDSSVGSYISQQIISQVSQTPFSGLVSGTNGSSAYRMPVRFFDQDAQETGSATADATYQVNVRIAPSPQLAGASVNSNMAMITVQVANNPGRAQIREVSGLWQETDSVSIRTYHAIVARAD